MAKGNSSISSQLSHGGCVGDEGRLTRSPPGPRTLRERVHDSTQHAVHDTCDGVQSDSQSTVYRQCEASNFEQEGDVEVERGLAAVSWRADATGLLFSFTATSERTALERLLNSSPVACLVSLDVDTEG